MEMENPKIEWLEKSGKTCLKFTFKESLDWRNAIIAIQKWQEAFASKPEGKIILIWDCLEMNDYDTEARKQWQKALKEMKNQIDYIWLITNSGLIKMGASVMSLLSSFEIKIVSSESEIKIE